VKSTKKRKPQDAVVKDVARLRAEVRANHGAAVRALKMVERQHNALVVNFNKLVVCKLVVFLRKERP